MLDIRFIRERPDLVKADLEKRQDFERLAWVDELLAIDSRYKSCLVRIDELRKKRNDLTEEINVLISQKKDFKDKVFAAKSLPEQIKALEKEASPFKEKIDWYLMRLPNILHETVPVGKDDSQNVVVAEVGEKLSKRNMPAHGELLEKNAWADFERASKIAGSGFYFLKGRFAQLELALERFALDKLVSRGYSLIRPPLMMNKSAYEGVTDLGDFESVMYKIENEDLYMIATSEHPMAAMFKDEIFLESELPLKLAGLSPCFRKEIGKHGVDTRGIFRVHQFNKIEQFVFCTPEQSWKFHEEIISNAEDIFSELGLAYRKVNICTGDIGTVAAKKYDLEAWMPREEKYREVVSGSNCTSYQAVRSNIKFRKKDGSKDYVHTLNSTAIATSRALRAIVETYYDGVCLKVPKVLQPYMDGLQEIQPEKKISGKGV